MFWAGKSYNITFLQSMDGRVIEKRLLDANVKELTEAKPNGTNQNEASHSLWRRRTRCILCNIKFECIYAILECGKKIAGRAIHVALALTLSKKICFITIIFLMVLSIILITCREDIFDARGDAIAVRSSFPHRYNKTSSYQHEQCQRWDPLDCLTLQCKPKGDNFFAADEVCDCYTPHTRVTPRVFIIGCQKCGSTRY